MPIYEYFCAHCNALQEIQQKITDPALTTCPLCHREGLTKQFSKNVGLQFKGSGFYTTDYPSQKGCCDSCSKCKNHN
jgi:putative FmdB family regulatory protein